MFVVQLQKRSGEGVNYDHLHVQLDHLVPVINASNVIREV